MGVDISLNVLIKNSTYYKSYIVLLLIVMYEQSCECTRSMYVACSLFD